MHLCPLMERSDEREGDLLTCDDPDWLSQLPPGFLGSAVENFLGRTSGKGKIN